MQKVYLKGLKIIPFKITKSTNCTLQLKNISLKIILQIILLATSSIIHSQTAIDNSFIDDDFFDFGMYEGITIHGERPKEYVYKHSKIGIYATG